MSLLLDIRAQVQDTTQHGGIINEAVVSANRDMRAVRPVKINKMEFKSVPALMGEADPLKVILITPGIQNNNEGDVGISIRGGEFDQTLVSIDDVPIYNPSHFKGFVSALNPDVISGVELFKGAFPAKYGSRLSGIVNGSVSEGSTNEWHGGISAGIISSKIYAEGPLIGNKTTISAAARVSYLGLVVDPILKKVREKGYGRGPLSSIVNNLTGLSYYDINGKIVHKIDRNNKLSAMIFNGRDIVRSELKTGSEKANNYQKILQERRDQDSEIWGNTAARLGWENKRSSDHTLDTYMYYSQYKNYIGQRKRTLLETSLYDTEQKKFFLSDRQFSDDTQFRQSVIHDYSLGSDFSLTKFTRHTINIGAKYSLQHLGPISGTESIREYYPNEDWNSVRENTIDESSILHTAAVYLEDVFSITKRLKIGAGARLSLYACDGVHYFFPEPRAQFVYNFIDDFSYIMSYSRMSQGLHLLSSSNVLSRSDVWISASSKIKPMLSDNYSAGFNYRPQRLGLDIYLEGYYKTMENLVEYYEGASDLTSHDWDGLVERGNGYAYGVEFMARKELGNTTGSVAYTWSKSIRQFETLNSGRWYYANDDCRNNIAVSLTQKFGKHCDLSLLFLYKSGKRITFKNLNPEMFDYTSKHHKEDHPIGDFYHFYSTPTYEYRNMFQLDDYHRLDLSLNIYLFHKFGKSTINLSVYNLYNQKNPYFLNLNTALFRKDMIEKVILFPILPSITYSFSF